MRVEKAEITRDFENPRNTFQPHDAANRVDKNVVSKGMLMVMTPRFFVLVLLLVCSVLAFAPELHAGASNKNGNPFGNGTFFDNSGTFSGVIRGQNLAGITQFSTTTDTLSTAQGSTFIYIEGVSFSGGVAATINPSAGTLNAFFSTDSQAGGGASLQGGGFLGTLQNSYPNQTFNGDGSVTDNLGYIYPISVNGVRISQ